MTDPELESPLFANPGEQALFDELDEQQIEAVTETSVQAEPAAQVSEVVRRAMERRARLGGRSMRWTMGGPYTKA